MSDKLPKHIGIQGWDTEGNEIELEGMYITNKMVAIYSKGISKVKLVSHGCENLFLQGSDIEEFHIPSGIISLDLRGSHKLRKITYDEPCHLKTINIQGSQFEYDNYLLPEGIFVNDDKSKSDLEKWSERYNLVLR